MANLTTGSGFDLLECLSSLCRTSRAREIDGRKSFVAIPVDTSIEVLKGKDARGLFFGGLEGIDLEVQGFGASYGVSYNLKHRDKPHLVEAQSATIALPQAEGLASSNRLLFINQVFQKRKIC